MGRVTLKDLARELGVSTTLVSRVLNAPLRPDGTPDCDISRETAERVLEAARRHDYKPSRMAAGLRSGKCYLLGVITPDISNYAFSEAGRYIEELAHNDGYSVMFSSSAESAKRMDEILDIFVSHQVDGIIVTPCAGSESILRKVIEKDIPLVLINRDVPGLEKAGRVFLDNIGSIRAVVDHLVENGYRHIEMISEKMDVLSLRDREDSYRSTMLSHGLRPYIYLVDSEEQEKQTREAVLEALNKGTEALITPRIILSLNTLKTLMEAGRRIPEDMALFCHDESPAWTTHVPTISYVSQCSDQVGTQAYHMLRRMISGAPGEQILISPKLFFGGSSQKK